MTTSKKLPLLNGVSISSIEVEQNGDLHVEFDLPTENQSLFYRTDIVGKRTFDVHQDDELRRLAQALFHAVRERLAAPDPERAKIDCMRCAESRCCREYDVLIDAADVERLAAHLKTSAAAFALRYCDPGRDWTGDFKHQLRKNKDAVGEKCVFLKRDRASGAMRCSVYEARPQICRDFDARDCTLFEEAEP